MNLKSTEKIKIVIPSQNYLVLTKKKCNQVTCQLPSCAHMMSHDKISPFQQDLQASNLAQ